MKLLAMLYNWLIGVIGIHSRQHKVDINRRILRIQKEFDKHKE